MRYLFGLVLTGALLSQATTADAQVSIGNPYTGQGITIGGGGLSVNPGYGYAPNYGYGQSYGYAPSYGYGQSYGYAPSTTTTTYYSSGYYGYAPSYSGYGQSYGYAPSYGYGSGYGRGWNGGGWNGGGWNGGGWNGGGRRGGVFINTPGPGGIRIR